MSQLALFLLLAGPTFDHRFVHFLAGVPIGEIRLTRKDGQYTYASQHFFRGGAHATERFSPSGSDHPLWASEALLAPLAFGCRDVEDEVTRKRGPLCVMKSGATTKGTLFDQPFTARYQAGVLHELELGDSRFSRRAAEEGVRFADPFADGLPLTGKGNALALSPPLRGTRRATPVPSGENEDCLAAANAWVKAHPDYEVVLGLLDDGQRGWPHAWVKHRTRDEELDPSRPQTADAPPRYLALPREEAARVYLDLLGKRRTLRRVSAP
jgi:hypothetical protein